MSTEHSKLLIIGSGPAGYTAAIYAARAMIEPTLVAGIQPGGQLTITTDVENYPGFAEVIQGPWLMTEMQTQAENVGARVMYDIVTGLDSTTRPFLLNLDFLLVCIKNYFIFKNNISFFLFFNFHLIIYLLILSIKI